MIRTLLIAAAALAAAGSASAADMIKVSVNGKTEPAIRAELASAAKAVCSKVTGYEDNVACVQAAYDKALERFERLKAAKVATLVF